MNQQVNAAGLLKYAQPLSEQTVLRINTKNNGLSKVEIYSDNISFSSVPNQFFANILFTVFNNLASFSSTRPTYIYLKTRTRGVLRTLLNIYKIERFVKIVNMRLFKSNISKKSFQVTLLKILSFSVFLYAFFE